MTDSDARITQRVPARLGDFRMGPVIGQGGSGVVYAAMRGDESVALKVLRQELALSPKEHRKFLEEAALLERVPHPSIVRLLAAGTLDDGRPYLAMPRLTGETLAERLMRGRMDLATALDAFEALADAVETIHKHGLVHRDIKPENVFLVSDGVGGERPVLLDFGIARDADAARSTTTEQGGVRGTPAYMAPERFFGTSASRTTDVYELAVVLYMMIVGHTPWDEDGGAASRLHPKAPSELGIALPEGMESSLLKALSTRPEVRPPSVAAFAAAIKAEASAPAATLGPPRPRASRGRGHRGAWLILGGLTLGAGAFGAASVKSWRTSAATVEPSTSPAPTLPPATSAPPPLSSSAPITAATSSGPAATGGPVASVGTRSSSGRPKPAKSADEPARPNPSAVSTAHYFEDRK